MTDTLESVVGTVPGGVSAPSEPRRRRPLLAVLGVLCSALGLVLVVATFTVPDAVDRVTGEAKVALDAALRGFVAPDGIPVIRLGAEGGVADLDRCDGTFTEMTSYRTDGVLPLFAAHNKCGGDIVLGWDIGQRVRVEGSDVVYEVVEERRTPKWSHVEQLEGMAGQFMLQTCFYGQNLMRFLSLSPVTH